MNKHKPIGPYEVFFKRMVDIIVSGLVIILVCWLYLILAVLVRINLGSPIIFTQDRPGKDGKAFRLYKFRSMNNKTDEEGGLLPGPMRLNKFGRILRSTSLDELPELFNILKGDMSLVGPRPEVRHYVNYWTPEQMHVLDVRPGITDPASIKYLDENELLEKAENPEKYYIEVFMQEKIKLYLQYVEKQSFLYDIALIFKTFWMIVTRESE